MKRMIVQIQPAIEVRMILIDLKYWLFWRLHFDGKLNSF
jgi:hypothetical protein